MLRLGSQSLTWQVLRLGLKPKEPSFKKELSGLDSKPESVAYVACFQTRVRNLNPVAYLAIAQIGTQNWNPWVTCQVLRQGSNCGSIANRDSAQTGARTRAPSSIRGTNCDKTVKMKRPI
ncbi:hypothetical protein DPMN_035155 [Dreissena polymorpha]|uniref:Uncharacterized protein n=1 Tax=Dreissena polymorpha TaxID=45954 RepID=A0A9D4M706_DREPO|nr:hypothetical protein DPMN_035155 [Dreissena polymorpha]